MRKDRPLLFNRQIEEQKNKFHIDFIKKQPLKCIY